MNIKIILFSFILIFTNSCSLSTKKKLSIYDANSSVEISQVRPRIRGLTQLDAFSYNSKQGISPGTIHKYEGVFPKHLVELLNKPVIKGPNCFNASLNFLGYSWGLYYSTPKEILNIVNSSLCKAIDLNHGGLTQGDLGIIRGKRGTVIHTFISLDNQLVFAKNNFESKSTLSIQTLKSQKEKFFVERICKTDEGYFCCSDCPATISYYRCEALEKVLPIDKAESTNIGSLLELSKNIEELLTYFSLPSLNYNKQKYLELEANTNLFIGAIKKFKNLLEASTDGNQGIVRYESKGDLFWKTFFKLKAEHWFGYLRGKMFYNTFHKDAAGSKVIDKIEINIERIKILLN